MTKLRKKYLKRQRLVGLVLFLISIIAAMFVELTIGCTGILLGLYFMVTKKVIFDRVDYIDELKERRRQWRLK